MKSFYFLLFSFFCLALEAQTIIDFEEFEIEQDSFLNGSDLSGGFESMDIFLPNDYNSDWSSWSGWALTNMSDITTPGFTNQYSSIAGSGSKASENYATSYVLGTSHITINRDTDGWSLESLQVNNSTYAYLSMRDGDAFAKKFGGETGDDPDYFLLTIKGYQENDFIDSIDFYLADYRFENNDSDYIIDEWSEINLESIILADSITFQLSSSDNGQFGMNTPSYFCLDDFQMGILYNTFNLAQAKKMNVYPNPTRNLINVKHELQSPTLYILDSHGRVLSKTEDYKRTSIDLSNLKAGVYSILLKNKEYYSEQRVIKL